MIRSQTVIQDPLLPANKAYEPPSRGLPPFEGTAPLPPGIAAGTALLTPQGLRPVEQIAPGDRILTVDDGLQTVRWVSRQRVRATGPMRPMLVPAGSSFGNSRDLVLAPGHMLMCCGYRVRAVIGRGEVLAAARDLPGAVAAPAKTAGWITYVSVMFDRHQLIFAEGAPCASFLPTAHAVRALAPADRDRLFVLRPDLRAGGPETDRPARLCLGASEARLLAA